MPRLGRAGALVVAILLISAWDLRAQADCVLSPHVGVSIPLSEPPFGDHEKLDLGVGIGGGVGFYCGVSGRLGLGAEVEVVNLEQLLLMHILGGVSTRFSFNDWDDMLRGLVSLRGEGSRFLPGSARDPRLSPSERRLISIAWDSPLRAVRDWVFPLRRAARCSWTRPYT